MEKKNGLSANHGLFVVVILMFLLGLNHGMRIDQQAERLKALRDSKMRGEISSTSTSSVVEGEDEEEWTTTTTALLLNNNVNVGDEESESSSSSNLKVGKMEDDLIEGGLPGQPFRVMFKQYSGHVTVDESKGRSLFYYFAEAVHDPSSKPLVLWLNGGPGCSSFGMGAMIELGPFGVEPDGKTLYRRRHSWNRVANTLFLESPAGVGFSYSNNTADYKITGDKRTAQDTYTFLINWFKRFPHYKARDFFITGESYAGYYIPELADTIIKSNKQGGSTSVIKLKGIMIGNGIMNDATDDRGRIDYYWSHDLISDETHQGLQNNCKNLSNLECQTLGMKIGKEVGPINFYNIYGPTCSSSSSLKSSRKLNKGEQWYDPCEENYVKAYLNLPQVQDAIHANETNLPYEWDFCSNVLSTWKDSPSTMFPIYKRLISSGLRILLYSIGNISSYNDQFGYVFVNSGDVDAVVPVTSTRYSINALNLTVIEPWHPWIDETEEVAGRRVVYNGLTFTTIRGAGHEVPRYQSRKALALLDSFLAGK